MSTLYEITGDYIRLLEMLEQSDDIDEQLFNDTLESIDGEFEEKADNYAKIIRELNAEGLKFKNEISRMTARMNTINNNIDKLKGHLYYSMKKLDKTSFKTDLFSFEIQKNGGFQPMEILPDMEIPDEYCKKEPDKAKIREALTSGQKLPFAFLSSRGEHLSIR